jgi:hypothetical protein
MRTSGLALLIALLASCGAEDEDIACCAIEPKAKCASALHGLGVTDQESRTLLGPVCESGVLTDARIRELDAQWPEACREAGITSPASRQSLCPPY